MSAVNVGCGDRGVRAFGSMVVVATDQFAGRKYRCACGWSGWSTWGHAKRHAAGCDQAQGKTA